MSKFWQIWPQSLKIDRNYTRKTYLSTISQNSCPKKKAKICILPDESSNFQIVRLRLPKTPFFKNLIISKNLVKHESQVQYQIISISL